MTLDLTGGNRSCERYCKECKRWLHYSRFRSRSATHRSVCSTWFNRICKSCEQKERNERKNVDRPLAIIENRAAARATLLGVSRAFMWINMNWRALVAPMRGMMTPEGLCLGCGHPFVNERDIQIDHIEPPRYPQDWAREHARNLMLGCGSCNRVKSNRPFAVHLDDQEHARLSNETNRDDQPRQPEQPGLFD